MLKISKILFATAASLTLAGCGGYAHILYAGPSNSLKATTESLQRSITRAEQSGCKIENVSMGAGHGVGLGVGVGVGVGINVPDDCPECSKKDLNRTVREKIERKASESVFGAIAMATCARPNQIDSDGNPL